MDGFQFTMEQRVVFRDVDMMGHVNNAVYATYFETARLEYLYAIAGDAIGALPLILAEITITYKSPAFLRETLEIGVRVAELRNSSFIIEGEIRERTTGRLVATSRAAIVHYDYAEQRPKPVPPEWRERFAQMEGRVL
ncbi:MAG: acyl-CoA thioesterase [Bacillota bacterium]